MSSNGHEAFVPCKFGIQRLHDLETIRLSYDPTNFQHLSLIARLFNPAFVNHSDDEDTPGLESVIEALPSMTFVLSELGIRLQFVATEEGSSTAHDPSVDHELRSFVEVAPCGVNVTWGETLMLRHDADCKITERWQTPFPMTAGELGVT